MDILSGWWLLWVWAPLAISIAIVVLLTVSRRRGRAPAKRRPDGFSRTEKGVASIIGAGAVLAAAVSTAGLVTAGIHIWTDEIVRVSDMSYGGSPVGRLADVEAVTRSGYESVWLDVSGLDGSARAMLYAESALPYLATIAISVATAWLAFKLIQNRPFVRALPVAIGVAAIAVVVAGIGSQVAGSIGRALVVEHLGVRDVTTPDAAGDALSYMTLSLDPSAIGWGIGLALVAAAFEMGARLQRETDLLV